MSYYQPPQPQQRQWDLTDPNAFRPYYRSGLQALTFNSRPIIQDLTVLANEHALRMAGIVADELEQHIRQAPPYMKLPALYLMDSIAKNVGPPYIALFTRFLERLFLQTYRQVDETVQTKMEELLGTWRTGGPNGTQLYPANNGRIQRTLEESLFGRGGQGGGIGGGGRGMLDNPHYVMSVQQRPSLAPPMECVALANDIKRVVATRQAQLYLNPHDATNQIAIEALQKLDGLVTSVGVTSEQVHQIRAQLSLLTPDTAPSYPTSYTQAPDLTEPSLLDIFAQIDPNTLSSLLAQQPPVASTSRTTTDDTAYVDQALAGVNLDTVSSAISGLDPGLLASLGAVLGTAHKEQQDKEAEYEARLFQGFDKAKARFGLSTAEINRSKGDAFQSLYDDLQLQCTQCSARWLDTPRHRKILQQHLDRHFRVNNRLSGPLRAQSRSWFVWADDWVSPTAAAEVQQEEQEEALNLAEIAKSRVVAPTDPAKAAKPCPICKEGFKSEWDEANEEWVWLDAKKVDKSIYHATCYAEMAKARTAARLLKEERGTPSLDSPLPGGTPAPEGTPALEEPVVEPAADAPGQTVPLDSTLLHAVADIVQRASTPDSSTSRSGKRPAEDEEAGEPQAKKVKQEVED